MFKVDIIYPDGRREELDDEDSGGNRWKTREEAEHAGLYFLEGYNAGGEVLNMSNPGDHPWSEDDEPDFEVIEVDE